jgi:AmmeMemoRadiSam system protein A
VKDNAMDTSLTKDQETSLLKLARLAITHYLKKGKPPKIEPEDVTFKQKRGAFVTLKLKGQLRGCVGYPTPYKPLYETIVDAAISAATKDFRFPSLQLKELSRTKIEISVLSLPEPVKEFSEIEVGKHGIIITKGLSRGLLLPQVPVEWDWDREKFLSHGCLKAGLEEDEWKRGVQIEKFSAQVFSE